MLQSSDWFLVGSLSSIAVFFFIFYFSKRDETYYLVFAIGCLVSMMRTVIFALVISMDQSAALYGLVEKTNHLTFIWGPYLYALLASVMFPSIGSRALRRALLVVAGVISGLILFVPLNTLAYEYAYDYIIITFIGYGMYVYTVALRQHKPYATPVFIANVVFIIGLLHDVMVGSYILSLLGVEILGFITLAYAAVMAAVLAHRYMQTDKKRLQARLKFLHAQIQPHFLYNTIGTISAYCQTDPPKASQLLDYLSTYLRGKFRDQSDQMILLRDELELVKAYLTIEQARFGDRIAVTYDIEDSGHVLIPCLSLQPLVENAVKHGILSRQEGGRIAISVKKREDAVVVTVNDNGVGMDGATLRRVLDGKADGIGVRNTSQRIVQHLHTRLEAASMPGQGSEFTVTIPVGGGSEA